MKTEVEIKDVVIDDFDGFMNAVKNNESFKITIYADEEIGMWIENESNTLMFDLTKESALFLGKSLVAMAESI